MENALVTSRPEFERLVSLVANGKSDNTRLAYRRALKDFVQWFESLPPGTKIKNGFSHFTVTSYIEYLLTQGLAPATINQRLAAVRQLAKNLWLNDALDQKQADAIRSIGNLSKHGTRTGYWLTPRQAKRLMATPDPETLRGKQQRLIIALLMGCGLRREEAAGLTGDAIQPRNDHWVIANLEGKGNRTRTIPISPWAIDIIHDWQQATGVTKGKLLRAISKSGTLTGPRLTKNGKMSDGGMSHQAIYNAVKKLANAAGLPPALGPHDLRRTWGKRAYEQQMPLDQISLILGHASIKTTEIYLGLKDVNLDNPVYVSYD